MTQFYSRNDVNYSGDVYSIPFDYIDKKEVKVYIDDELWTKWHFLNKHQLTLDEVPEDIRYSNIISVRRETDIEEKVVTYDNNSLLTKENLNKSQDQLLFAVQEIYDNNVQFQSDIREEVDEKVERVSDAVEKLEFLEDSVEIANEAALEAAEQAQIATEKAEETLNTFNEAMTEIDTLRQDSIDEVNQLVADHTDDLNALDQLIKKDADAIIDRVGLNMFDTVLKDHILTYEESKGLALQGTYVYKTAVAGERYGYPDFYAKCLEEKDLGEVTEVTLGNYTITMYLNANGHKFYDIADKEAIDAWFETYGTCWYYGIDTENERIYLPRNIWFEQLTADSSEVGSRKTAGLPNITGGLDGVVFDAADAQQKGALTKSASIGAYCGSGKGESHNNITFNASLSNPIYGNSDTVQPNAVKKLLYICVGNTVSDTSWVDVVTQVEGGVKDIEEAKDEAIDELKNIAGGTVPLGFIGSAILGIDETLGLQRYLNGQIIIQDQFKGFTQFLKRRIELYPSVACTEEEWQTEVTRSAFSQCGKFVIDNNSGTIRLPKVVNIQGLTDLSKLAEIVKAGLPNITGTFPAELGGSSSRVTGAFYYTGSTIAGGHGEGTDHKTGFDASRSSAVYGRSNTVQQEQIQYPYFIQVATGAETEDNIINKIELNNPFSLLDYKYSEYELNNLSWLRSNGQYNSKAIYPAVYDLLLKIYNGTETKAGVSVKLSTETFTDYDFVLNTAEETFRLPIKVKLASGKAVVGNGTALGLTIGSQNFALHSNAYEGSNGHTYACIGDYGKSTGSASGGGANPTSGRVFGVTTDATKSGIELSDNGLYLYFYVGETVQNANLINAGRIEEKLSDKVDTNASNFTADGKSLISGYAMPSNKYIDLTLGASDTHYTAPANGFVIFEKACTGNNQFIQLMNKSPSRNDLIGMSTVFGTGSGASIAVHLPVKRGDIFKVAFNAGGALGFLRFIYAEGEV